MQVGGDLKFEADETLVVNLSQPQGASIADNQGIGTINNGDGASIAIGDVLIRAFRAGGFETRPCG